MDGYTATVDGYDITNTHEPATTSVTVEKKWEDFDNKYDTRPDSIQVSLLADGIVYAEADVSAAGSWTYEFKNLPKFRVGGTEIKYTVAETKVPGYQTEIDGYTITNTLETTALRVVKKWDDDNDYDKLRPESIQLQLYANGEKFGDVYELAVTDNTAHIFTNLPRYDKSGELITYTVEEIPVDGYEATYHVSGFTTTITNTHVPETISLTVNKEWVGEATQDYIEFQLVMDGAFEKGADGKDVLRRITKQGGWSVKIDGLRKFNERGGIMIYDVKEVREGLGFILSDYHHDYTNHVITLENTAVVNISVEKQWEDENNQDKARPDSVKVDLYAGEELVETAEIKAADGWKYVFVDMPKYGADGKEVEYWLVEQEVHHYIGWVEGSAEDGFVLTNCYEAPVEITVTKVWDDDDNRDGIRPESVTVYLLADGEKYGEFEITAAEDDWSINIGGLYKLNEDGKEIKYTVSEKPVDGYSYSIAGNGTTDVTITNKHVPETVDLDVVKKWIDNNDEKGDRPDYIQVQLYANGEKYGDAVKITENGEWKYTFQDLPKNEDGKAINYTVKETGVTHYIAKYTTQDGDLVITNTYTDIPLTGDAINLIFWIVMVMGCACLLGGIGFRGFRRRSSAK